MWQNGGHVTFEQHFAYRDSSGAIQDAWWEATDAQPNGDPTSWRKQQINLGGKTNGKYAASDPFLFWTGREVHFVYRDGNEAIQDAWYDGSNWYLQQINLPAGNNGAMTAGPAAAGNPFVIFFGPGWGTAQKTGSDQAHFVYRDKNGGIQDAFFDYSTHRWSLQLINGQLEQSCVPHQGCFYFNTGKVVGPPAAGDPVVFAYNAQQHFVYRDINGVIEDAVYDTSTGNWFLQQNCFAMPQGGVIRSICSDGIGSGAPPAPAAGDLMVSFYPNLKNYYGEHYAYRDNTGSIQDIWWDPRNNFWHQQKIKLGGGTGNSAMGNPFVYSVQKEMPSVYWELHFVYRDVKGDIWDTCYNCGSSSDWSVYHASDKADAVGDPFASLFPNGSSIATSQQFHIAYPANSEIIYDTHSADYASWFRQEILPNPPSPPSPPTTPPPSTWTLTLQAAGQAPGRVVQWNFGGTVAVEADINTITYVVIPDWNSGLSQTVTPSQPTGIATVTLPVPNGSIKTVTVTVSGKWSSNGGTLYNGFYSC
jgi:hypothetical protein